MNNIASDSEIERNHFLKIAQVIDRYVKGSEEGAVKASAFETPISDLFDNYSGVIGVIDFLNKNYPYISSSCQEMFGYSPLDFRIYGLSLVPKILAEEHASIFLEEIHPTIFATYQAHLENDEAKKIKITYTNKMKMKDGSIKWMLHQLNVLETDESGMPVIGLKTISEIEGIKRDNVVDLAISKKSDQGTYEILLKKSFYPSSSSSSSLTGREREILQLVREGLSGKQIAERLFLSEHTVYTHKKNMLKKFNLCSSSELVSFAIGKGMIS